MPHYKDSNNKLYFLDSAEFEHLIPGDCVLITEDETLAIYDQEEQNRLASQVIVVTPLQMRKALNQSGLRDVVEAAIAASTDQNLKDSWEFSGTITRNHAFVVSIGVALNKTVAELDAIFELAATL